LDIVFGYHVIGLLPYVSGNYTLILVPIFPRYTLALVAAWAVFFVPFFSPPFPSPLPRSRQKFSHNYQPYVDAVAHVFLHAGTTQNA
jgi:hypothetical protein